MTDADVNREARDAANLAAPAVVARPVDELGEI